MKDAEERVSWLHAEIRSTEAASEKAGLYFAAGALQEWPIGNVAQAVREYLAAYNADPQFSPALEALIRIFERRRSTGNLSRLYEAAVQSTLDEKRRASHLVDRAQLREDEESDGVEARLLLHQALDHAPGDLDAALALERSGRLSGDDESTLRALQARAEHSEDPTLRAHLLWELALEMERLGDVEQAIALAKESSTVPSSRYRSLGHLERLARRTKDHPTLIGALEGQARLAVAALKGEDQGQTTGSHSAQHFSNVLQTGAEAIALYREAARLRAQDEDFDGALAALDEAIALDAEHHVLHLDRLFTADQAGRLDLVHAEAQWLLEAGVTGALAAVLHHRVAEWEAKGENLEAARTALEHALREAKGSPAGTAMLEDLLLRSGDHGARINHLRALADEASKEGRASLLWRAAQIAAEQLKDMSQADELYAASLKDADAAAIHIAREWYGAARRHGAPKSAQRAAEHLLNDASEGLGEQERVALTRELYLLLRYETMDAAAADALLARCVLEDAHAEWALDAAWLHGALSGRPDLLEAAHLQLSQNARDEDARAAHLCAAARALLVGEGDEDGLVTSRAAPKAEVSDAAMKRASGHLRSALEVSPDNPYAVALLEELLRQQGESTEVVALLREAAGAEGTSLGAEASFLSAGAAAETAGDLALAAQTYREAAELDPAALAPLHALRRVARKRNDTALELEALEGLSERELAPGLGALSLAEFQAETAARPEQAAELLLDVLDHERIGALAAVHYLLLPARSTSSAGRKEALTRLRDHVLATDVVGQGTTQESVIAQLPTAPTATPVGATFSRALLEEDSDAADDDEVRLEQLMAQDATAMAATLRALMGLYRDGHLDDDALTKRADLWVALAEGTEDTEAAAQWLLHGLRARLVAAGPDAADDAFLLSQELLEASPEAHETAIALEDTLSGGDDPEARVDALQARLALMPEGEFKEARAGLVAALGRAQLAAGQHEEAVQTLTQVLRETPKDYASLDALRVAAREIGAFEDVVLACRGLADALAETAHTDLRAALLEEAGQVLMDELDRIDEAKTCFTAALAIESRDVSFGRMHDLLAEAGDDEGLLRLVETRIDRVDAPEQLTRLHYERARLLRSSGKRDAALLALNELLLIEPDHVGALALMVEIYASMSRFRDAVEALDSLAKADVPGSQRKLALVGAADFLEHKLDDVAGAVTRLEEAMRQGLCDHKLLLRTARAARRSAKPEIAARALENAADKSSGVERASVLRALAEVLERDLAQETEARAALARALSAMPTDAKAADHLYRLTDEPDARANLVGVFEAAVRKGLKEEVVEPTLLRGLALVAQWREDENLEWHVLGILTSLQLSTGDERARFDALAGRMGQTPRGALTVRDRATLVPEQAKGAWLGVTSGGNESLNEVTGATLSALGVGRGQLIKPKVENAARDEALRVCAVFDLTPDDTYQGGVSPTGLRLLAPKAKRTALVLGDGIKAPFSSKTRFALGRACMGHLLGEAAWFAGGHEQARSWCVALAAAVDAPIDGESPEPEKVALLSKKLGRREKRQVLEALSTRVRTSEALERYLDATVTATLQAGLLVSGDLHEALTVALGRTPTLEAVAQSERARSLLLFWLSDHAVEMRRTLGLSL